MICSRHMAALELPSSSLLLEQRNFKGLAGSMRRARGMGRGQQRDPSMDTNVTQSDSQLSMVAPNPPRPTRNNSKLKVLVRSHAMREETSPPREPTPTPCITLIPSPSVSPEQAIPVVESPVSSPHHQCHQHFQQQKQPCVILSPTDSPTIVIATPPASSPNHVDNDSQAQEVNAAVTSKINVNGSPDSKSDSVLKSANGITNSNSSPIQTSNNQKNCLKLDTQLNVDINTRARTEQIHYICDCDDDNCTNCSKTFERNMNNNNSNNINNNNVVTSNTLSVNRAKSKLRQQNSSLSSFEGSSSTSPCLSRDSSTEQYTDTTGIDLTQFILETLNKNAKDRILMLKIEQELVNLAKDKIKTHYKFPPMSSYQRMLVHRCAAYFGMDHNIEMSGKCVVVNKTKSTRIPEMRFRDHIREDYLFPEEPRRSILKRDSNSFEDCNYKSPDRQFDNRRSKSFEEREEEYEKVRRRIFKDGSEEFNWAEMPWPESECSKIRLLPPEHMKQNKLLKVQSVDGKSETQRPCVAKSYSFGGYGGAVSVLTRGDSVTSTHSAGPRLLTKQDSSTSTISWRLSPSSSGYKSQSQRSDSVTPSPTATPHQLSDASGKNSLEAVDSIRNSITEETIEQAQQSDTEAEAAAGDASQLVWAVTDMQSVPKGSVLIDPQTGQPFTNQDGTIYHFDPSNPPPGFSVCKPPTPTKPPTPNKSPVKETTPKKQYKSKTSPLKNKSYLINSSTSPSLPLTPPSQPPAQSSHTHQQVQITYPPSAIMENPSNIPMQNYPVYSNGYMPTNVPPADNSLSLYQQPVGMMYNPFSIPSPYENRPDASMSDLSGYFMNMGISEPSCSHQTMGYQHSNGYWSQQPITYYPSAVNQQQRYPVHIPVAGQNQNSYVSSANYPPNYIPIAPNPNPVPPATDLVPVYTNTPVQMMYPAQQSNPTNPLYIQNSNPVYMQNSTFSQGSMYPYPPSTSTPNPPPTNATYTTPNQFTSNCQNFIQNATYDQRQQRSTPKNNNKQLVQKIHGQNVSQMPQGSNQSSEGSNSPANTVITGYFPNANAYRQGTPPGTPPTQNLGYTYSSNYVPHSVILRPLSAIRGSPPVNIRTSRSPTPAPEYSQMNSVERNQRFSVGPPIYHSMPCIMPGDVRLMTNRSQASFYRQPYRQQTVTQVVNDNNCGRSQKVRKPRTKVPALPPSGRQSHQPVQPNIQQRF